MELIQIEQIRLNEAEKKILNSAFYIINQVHEKTVNPTLSTLTGELIDGLVSLEDFYE